MAVSCPLPADSPAQVQTSEMGKSVVCKELSIPAPGLQLERILTQGDSSLGYSHSAYRGAPVGSAVEHCELCNMSWV